jgi:hypothetical protein
MPLPSWKINPESGGKRLLETRQKTPWTIRFQPVQSTPCMKSNALRTFLEWALITSLLMSVGFFGWYYVRSRKVRICQWQIENTQFRFQKNHAVMGLLLAQCQQYAKTNREMAQLLDSLRAQPSVAATNKPAATTNKPVGK